MNPRWFERADWPTDWEIERRRALMGAVSGIPGGLALTSDDCEGKALRIFSAAAWGANEEAPRNRPASQDASEAELRKLHELCGKLAEHIEKMRRPAVAAFYQEGGDLFSFASAAKDAAETARAAFSDLNADGSGRGAGKKVEAARTAEIAAQVFEEVTGDRPTFTTDPATNGISGAWPDFLGEVFGALRIVASVESQVRAAREKMRSETAI